MAKATDLKDMDVEALLELRADVDRVLAERRRDMEKQLAALGLGGGKRGRPTNGTGRGSHLKGVKVAPKYRGPGGETWAGRGATPRWLAALVKEGHSIEEFLISAGRRKAAVAARKKKVVKKKAVKVARKPRRAKAAETKAEPTAA